MLYVDWTEEQKGQTTIVSIIPVGSNYLGRISAHIASQESEDYCFLRAFDLARFIVIK